MAGLRRAGRSAAPDPSVEADLAARLVAYVDSLFVSEDDLQKEIRREVVRRDIEHMQVSAGEGKLLHILCRAIAARRVIEVGTLLGYSAIWMARALPPDGEVITHEVDTERAELARRFIARAGLDDIVEVRVGAALERLRAMDDVGSFDVFFIDADKENYVAYMQEATRLLRPGGLLLADNAFWSGRVLEADPDDQDTRGIQEFNSALAASSDYSSTILAIRDGLALGVKLHRT